MDVKEGDKIRYIDKSQHDLTHGRVYMVEKVYPKHFDFEIEVIDDGGELNSLASGQYEPTTQPEEPEPVEEDWRLTNRVPWGMLTKQEREQMEDWPHGWAVCHDIDNEWRAAFGLGRYITSVYRAKPAPEVTSRWVAITEKKGTPDRKAAMPLFHQDCIGMIRIDTDQNGNTTLHIEDV